MKSPPGACRCRGHSPGASACRREALPRRRRARYRSRRRPCRRRMPTTVSSPIDLGLDDDDAGVLVLLGLGACRSATRSASGTTRPRTLMRPVAKAPALGTAVIGTRSRISRTPPQTTASSSSRRAGSGAPRGGGDRAHAALPISVPCGELFLAMRLAVGDEAVRGVEDQPPRCHRRGWSHPQVSRVSRAGSNCSMTVPRSRRLMICSTTKPGPNFPIEETITTFWCVSGSPGVSNRLLLVAGAGRARSRRAH